MITKYGVAYANNIDELVSQVNSLLQEGWTLYGSIGIDTNSRGDKLYFQTMIIETSFTPS